jgi:uncharacterized protein
MLNFPCTTCGVCCQHISHLDELKEFDRGDGCCKYLLGNKCSIYNTRPLICRVDKMFDTFYKQHMTEEEFIYLNLLACKGLQTSHNVSQNLHVIIPENKREGGII